MELSPDRETEVELEEASHDSISTTNTHSSISSSRRRASMKPIFVIYQNKKEVESWSWYIWFSKTPSKFNWIFIISRGYRAIQSLPLVFLYSSFFTYKEEEMNIPKSSCEQKLPMKKGTIRKGKKAETKKETPPTSKFWLQCTYAHVKEKSNWSLINYYSYMFFSLLFLF